jgi:NAD(P)-dependent dehydrogenase (short-subunit alcohol dehydrogenase family)
VSHANFAEKVVIVTGSGGGLGRAVALAFASRKAKVALADINGNANFETLHSIEAAGGHAIAITTDVADKASVADMVRETVGKLGDLDIAVNNAGIEQQPGFFLDLEEEVFDRVLSVNLRGIFLCMQAEIRAMLPQNKGAIVNITSITDEIGAAGNPAYVASKHGALGLTRSIALEFAKLGIRINAVSPGGMRTAMYEAVEKLHPDVIARGLALHPIGRIANLDEVVNAVLFLASDEASFILGHSLKVDGGYTAA